MAAPIFTMRPEQEAAVEKATAYFKSYRRENNKPPHFLWNCKMGFDKTFAAYSPAKGMDWEKELVLSFKPTVQSAAEEDWQWMRVGKGGSPMICWQFQIPSLEPTRF